MVSVVPAVLPVVGVPTPMVRCDRHAELTQNGVPPLHLVAQLPQAFGSLVTSCSQPSRRSVLQSPQPVWQAVLHAPLVQLGVPWFELHFTRQLPQLLMSLLVGCSQPLLWVVSQFAKPGLQVATWQPPLTHW